MEPLDSARRGRREQAKAHNRAEILGAARQVFSEMGYGAASIRDIVRRTTLAAGTFYNYFPDKESIFRTLIEDSTRQVRVRVRAARDRARTLEEFVGDAYRAYFDFVAEDRVTFELMRRNDAAIRALLGEPALMAAAEELMEDLRAGVDRGTLPRLDVEYMAAAMYGVAFEVSVRMVDRQPVDVEGATRFAATVFLAAIDAFRRDAPQSGGPDDTSTRPRPRTRPAAARR